jgi:hypothetical protein
MAKGPRGRSNAYRLVAASGDSRPFPTAGLNGRNAAMNGPFAGQGTVAISSVRGLDEIRVALATGD